MPRFPLRLRSLALPAILVLSSCSRACRPDPPASPEAAARLLVRMACAPDRVTDWPVVAEKGRIEADPVLFATTAAALGKIGESCDVVRVEPASEDRRAVDLRCALQGGGAASLTITAEELPDRTWRVVSVEGPGIGWPAPRPTVGDGLTTSAPP